MNIISIILITLQYYYAMKDLNSNTTKVQITNKNVIYFEIMWLWKNR